MNPSVLPQPQTNPSYNAPTKPLYFEEKLVLRAVLRTITTLSIQQSSLWESIPDITSVSKDRSLIKLEEGLSIADGKYKLTTCLGYGGQAEVWEAQQQGLAGFSKPIVLKLMTPGRRGDPRLYQHLLREAQLASLLTHPNIAEVYDVGEENGLLYIAMERVHGRDLEHVLQRSKETTNQPIPWALAAFMVADVCKGLHHVHSKTEPNGEPLGLVHRDLKPSNLLLNIDGYVKVIDFGVAKAATTTQVTQQGAVRGTPAYMAPEQIRSLPIDHRSDLFSLGTVLYELCTGQRAFHDEDLYALFFSVLSKTPTPPRDLVPAIPLQLQQIIEKALQKDPEERYQSAQDLQKALQDVLRQQDQLVSHEDTAAFYETIVGKDSTPTVSIEELEAKHVSRPTITYSGGLQDPLALAEHANKFLETHQLVDDEGATQLAPPPLLNPFTTPVLSEADDDDTAPQLSKTLISLRDQMPEQTNEASDEFLLTALDITGEHPGPSTPHSPPPPPFASITPPLQADETVHSSPVAPRPVASPFETTTNETIPPPQIVDPFASYPPPPGDDLLAQQFNDKNREFHSQLQIPASYVGSLLEWGEEDKRKKALLLAGAGFFFMLAGLFFFSGENTPPTPKDNNTTPRTVQRRPTPRQNMGTWKPFPTHTRRANAPQPRLSQSVPDQPPEPRFSIRLRPQPVPHRPTTPTTPTTNQPPIPRPQTRMGTIRFRISPACTLYQGRRRLGRASRLTIQRRAGWHRFRCIDRRRRLTKRYAVKVHSGKTFSIRRRYRKGRLFLVSYPWSSVHLHPFGRIGYTQAPVTLYEGRYKLILKKMGKGPRKIIRVRIRAGRMTRPRVIRWQ